jgi:hypothetical protein
VLLTSSENKCRYPCIIGTDGTDFGVVWEEMISDYWQIRFAIIEYDSEEDEYNVTTPVTISDSSSKHYKNPVLKYVPSQGGYSDCWYAVFSKKESGTDSDIYIDRYPWEIGGSWDTDEHVANSAVLDTLASIDVKRSQNDPEEGDPTWFDYIIVSYDHDNSDDLKVSIMAWDYAGEEWDHYGYSICSVDDSNRYYSDPFILNLRYGRFGVLYWKDDISVENVRWYMDELGTLE